MLVLLTAQDEEWDELNGFIHAFRQLNMALKYSPKPVVAAPFGLVLGGGCEVPLHCAGLQASAESYTSASSRWGGPDPRRWRHKGNDSAHARFQGSETAL